MRDHRVQGCGLAQDLADGMILTGRMMDAAEAETGIPGPLSLTDNSTTPTNDCNWMHTKPPLPRLSCSAGGSNAGTRTLSK